MFKILQIKNERKRFDLIYHSSVKSNFFIFSFVFLEKLGKTQIAFEIIWPLPIFQRFCCQCPLINYFSHCIKTTESNRNVKFEFKFSLANCNKWYNEGGLWTSRKRKPTLQFHLFTFVEPLTAPLLQEKFALLILSWLFGTTCIGIHKRKLQKKFLCTIIG